MRDAGLAPRSRNVAAGFGARSQLTTEISAPRSQRSVDESPSLLSRRNHARRAVDGEPVPMSRDEVVAPVANSPRHQPRDSCQRAPRAAEVAHHAQRGGRSHERRRVVHSLEPDDRIGRRELGMATADRRPRGPLQAREVERPRADIVPQDDRLAPSRSFRGASAVRLDRRN